MAGTYYRKRSKDATHDEIAQVLTDFGWSVLDTTEVGRIIPGYPDMQIGLGGIDNMVEAKRDPSAKLRASQEEFARKWRGAKIVRLNSKAEAIEWASRTRHERRRQPDQRALEPCVHTHQHTAEIHRGEPKQGV